VISRQGNFSQKALRGDKRSRGVPQIRVWLRQWFPQFADEAVPIDVQ
jgi:hypothetical protein